MARPPRRERASPSAGTSAPAMNGYPARSIFMGDGGQKSEGRIRPRLRGASGRRNCLLSMGSAPHHRRLARTAAADDVFHLILQVQIAYLEVDFFELFGFREVVSSGQAV